MNAWEQTRVPLVTYETLRPVSDYRVIAVSVAYETELAGLADTRRPVLPGGVAILQAVFDAFELEQIETSTASMRTVLS